MKRLFPRAVPEAFALWSVLGVVLLGGAACAPGQGVKPGAPVLAKLSIVEPSGNRVDMTADTAACVGFDPSKKVVPDASAGDAASTEAGTDGGGDASGAEGGTAQLADDDGGADAGSDAGSSDAGSAGGSDAGGTSATVAKEGGDCDPMGDAVCTLGGVTCHCVAKDMCDPTIDSTNVTTSGTLVCTYAPMSTVIATFDRLLDTAPFTGTDGMPTSATVATLQITPTPQPTPTASGTYRSDGSPTGLVFTNFFNITGPTVSFTGSPGFPTSSTVTSTLDGAIVRAKDGKTAFAGMGALATGVIGIKTAPFSLDGITVPTPPAAMDTSGGGAAMGCPTTMMMTSGDDDGGTSADGASEAGTTDGSSSDGASDGSSSDAGAPADAASDAKDAAADAPAADAASDDAAASDAGASDGAAPATSTDVALDMNKAPVTINFNNPVNKDAKSHITITQDGQLFSDFDITTDDSFPTAVITITPKKDASTPPDPTKDQTWAAGKTYVVTVSAGVADVFGATTTDAQAASFTMSSN